MSSDVDWHTSERTGKFSASHFRYYASLSLMNSPQNIHTNSYHRAALAMFRHYAMLRTEKEFITRDRFVLSLSLFPPCLCMMMMSNENGNYWKTYQKPEINGIKFFFQLLLFLMMRRVEMPNENSVNEKWRNFWAFHVFFLWWKNEPTFWFYTGWFPENKSQSEKTLTHFLSRREKWKM